MGAPKEKMTWAPSMYRCVKSTGYSSRNHACQIVF
jgi:hypothetical protein